MTLRPTREAGSSTDFMTRPNQNNTSVDDHLQQAVGRCLTEIRLFRDAGRTGAAKLKLASEVYLMTVWLLQFDLHPGAISGGFVKPVETSLLKIYGPDLGRELHGDFLGVFEQFAMPLLSRCDDPELFRLFKRDPPPGSPADPPTPG